MEKKRATDGTRTHDPSLTKRLLCQLSYGGVRKLRLRLALPKSGNAIEDLRPMFGVRKLRLRGRTYGSPNVDLPKLDGVRKLRLRLALPKSGNAAQDLRPETVV